MPKRWALILAGCAIAVIVNERVAVLRAPAPAVNVAQEAAPSCAPLELATERPDTVPSVAQPGGMDPLGVSRAIHRVIEDCP
jgi:hypothetical protein